MKKSTKTVRPAAAEDSNKKADDSLGTPFTSDPKNFELQTLAGRNGQYTKSTGNRGIRTGDRETACRVKSQGQSV